jgi:acyl carrier protein
MTRPEIVQMIIRAVQDMRAPGAEGEITEDTRLFGKSGVFDSLGLVSFISEVEAQINDATGTDLVLTSERAMSQQWSPFRSVRNLADYVSELLLETAREA